MGGSLLKAIGLPELICNSQNEYEELAIALGLDRSRIKVAKEKLFSNRLNTPLFDIKEFSNNLEMGFEQAYERHLNNMPLNHIIVNSRKDG
jgi:predicted O-linked N-acetylglucosamine transferase (SPINDLY family)